MVTCPIDFNFFEDPRFLPCGHVFCCKCLNSYLRQLLLQSNALTDITKRKNLFLPCPICRKHCPIPEDGGGAEIFPKAFNHKLILEFVLSQTSSSNQALFTEANGHKISSHGNALSSASPGNRRKQSILVKPNMLKGLVDDITAIQRSGGNSYKDRVTILQEVQKIIRDMPASSTLSNLERNLLSDPLQLEAEIAEPSAPPKHDEDLCHLDSVNTQSSSTGGRFNNASRYVLNNSIPPDEEKISFGKLDSDHRTSANSRSIELAHENMRRKSKYKCFKLEKKLINQLQSLPNITAVYFASDSAKKTVQLNSTNCIQTDSIIHLWHRNFDTGRKSRSTPICQKLRVELTDLGQLQVQYLRFSEKCIYFTGILQKKLSTSDVVGNHNTDLDFPGVLVCCSIPELVEGYSSKAESDSIDSFPIVGHSCLFMRDALGRANANRPVISGLDIDRQSGAIYVALCANAMVCRLYSNDLGHIDKEWFINTPELSPSYLCLARSQNEIWASCPYDEKVFILDLATDIFHHFTPTISFGIAPSHIIYTSDDRILILDSKLSRIFWIQRVDQTIIIERIDDSLNERKTRGIDIIQPVDSIDACDGGELAAIVSLPGGVMCADRLGSYLVYPKEVLRGKSVRTCCG